MIPRSASSILALVICSTVLIAPARGQVQPNSPEASLVLNGRESAGFSGTLPVLAAAGQVMTYELSGLPAMPFAIFEGPALEPGLASQGGLANVKLSGSTLLLNGFDPAFAAFVNTGASGTRTFTGSWPALAPGTTATFQAVMMGPSGLVNTAPATVLTVPGDPIPPSLQLAQVIPGWAAGNRHAVLADVDNDQNLDAIVSSRIHLGNGAFGFLPGGIDPAGVEMGAADLIGDGNVDLVMFDDIFGGVLIYEGDGSGSFNPPAAIQFAPSLMSNDAGDLAIADLDGNGHADLVVADAVAPPGVTFLLNFGAGNFAFVPLNSTSSSRAVAVADFNGDQHPDIAMDVVPVLSQDASTVILWGDGSGNFTLANAAMLTAQPEDGSTWLRARDVNGDQAPDLLWAGTTSQGVLLNDGTGGFSYRPIPVPPAACCILPQLEAADMDKDGNLDVVFVNKTPTHSWLVIARNDGAANFGTTWFVPVEGNPLSAGGPGHVVPGDFDNDGDTDLMVGGVPATLIENQN